MKLLEPLRRLFKEQKIPQLGRKLGLPEIFVGFAGDIISFSGPALRSAAGEITREKLDILRNADAVYMNQMRRKASLCSKIWQAFAVLLQLSRGAVKWRWADLRICGYEPCRTGLDHWTDEHNLSFYPFDMKFLERDRHPHHQRGQGREQGRVDVTAKLAPKTEWRNRNDLPIRQYPKLRYG